MSLTRPYEKYPFLVYGASKQKLTPVDVQYMTMLKFHNDFIRYDFFHNCTDVLSFSDKQRISDSNGTDSFPQIWEYISKQYNVDKYDVLHVFQDAYQIYEKSHPIVYNEDSGDDEDDSISKAKETNSEQSSDKVNAETPKSLQKGIVGVGSVLLIGVLKLVGNRCVKLLMREGNVDDDKAKEGLKKGVSSVSNVVNKHVAGALGLEVDDDEDE